MPRTETTNDFAYDEELMTELLLAYKSAERVTGDKESAVGILKCYVDMRVAQYQQELNLEWAMGPEEDD